MFTILNRLRGTYSWFSKVNGVVLGLLIYLIFQNQYIAILVAIGYVAGESFGWGEWVGTLTTNRTTPVDNSEGKNNGIRWIASKIVNPYAHWRRYCKVALTIRGFYWWFLALVPLMYVMSWVSVLLASIALAVGFPVACKLGRLHPLNIKFKYWQAIGSWESQEVYYGIMQDIVLLILLLGSIL